MTSKTPPAANPRLRQFLGYAATALAALASIATSYSPGPISLSLPDTTVTLGPDALEVRKRFHVESDNGFYALDLRFDTLEEANPSLQLLAVDDTATRIEMSSELWQFRDSRHASLHPSVEMACLDQLPCVATFEVIATADLAASSTVTGTLAIEVGVSGFYAGEGYLAIEPL